MRSGKGDNDFEMPSSFHHYRHALSRQVFRLILARLASADEPGRKL